jgi:hypothetical protein
MSADTEMMSYNTSYFKGEVDFVSPGGPLRSLESEINVATVGTEYDLGTRGLLSIPPEGADIWKEWRAADTKEERVLGAGVLKALEKAS